MAPLRVLDPKGEEIPLRQVGWECGKEEELGPLLSGVDVLVLNHGVNPFGARDPEALALALDVNALSHWRLLELFAREVAQRGAETDGQHSDGPGASGSPRHLARPPQAEVWINTSEAEIQPALSPLYEISKRLLGELLSLRALDLAATLRIRRLVLGPFRSALNPYGVMSADWVAGEILRQAGWDCGLILVTPNPLTYVLMPLAALTRRLYFGLVSRPEPPGA